MKGSRTLDRYVLRRFALALVLSIIGLVLIAMIIDLTENIDTFIDFDARPAQVMLYYIFHIPYWTILTLPIAALLGTLFALTGLARRNEIAAMKAVGISLFRILQPVFLCALGVSAVAFVFTDRIVPRATFQYNQVRDRITSRNRADGSRRQVLLQDVDGQLIYARSYDASRQTASQVSYERTHRHHVVERINAQRMAWRHDEWMLLDGVAFRPHAVHDDTATAWGRLLRPVPFDSLSLPALTLRPADLGRQRKRPEEMSYAELSRYIHRATANGEDATRQRVDLHLKISFPLTCLIIVILGAPLGANARRAGLANSFGLGIAVCFVFYSCVKAGQALAWNQLISPWAGAWAVNIFFAVLSLVLLWRAHT